VAVVVHCGIPHIIHDADKGLVCVFTHERGEGASRFKDSIEHDEVLLNRILTIGSAAAIPDHRYIIP